MNSHFFNENHSVFRTEAWVQAWLDTWGNDSRIRLIDLGGRKNPLEVIYSEKPLLKKVLPFQQLNLAGVGGALISSPRAEYNHFNHLVSLCGGSFELFQELKKLQWQSFELKDLLISDATEQDFIAIASIMKAYIHQQKVEPTYQVNATDFHAYVAALGANTRLKYFNRRDRLSQLGVVEKKRYTRKNAYDFFALLNRFHELRWGRPCYSASSQKFMENFQERLQIQGGDIIMESLSLDGEIVSVIYDFVWSGRRYNVQSGYLENRFPKVALGAVHLGYAIEEAIANKQVYDFMAGFGKNTNYKESIANAQLVISHFSLLRHHIKLIRKCYDFMKGWRYD